MTPAQLRQRSEAGKKGGVTTVARYGRAHMHRIGLLGGRPTWQAAIAKANGNPVRPGAKQEVARAGHQVGPGSHSNTGKKP